MFSNVVMHLEGYFQPSCSLSRARCCQIKVLLPTFCHFLKFFFSNTQTQWDDEMSSAWLGRDYIWEMDLCSTRHITIWHIFTAWCILPQKAEIFLLLFKLIYFLFFSLMRKILVKIHSSITATFPHNIGFPLNLSLDMSSWPNSFAV